MADPELEETLRDYLWLAANTPNSHADRVEQLLAECRRRCRPEIVERARARVEKRAS
jgi:hypothetical protein